MLGRTRAGNEILFRKISAELAWNSFRYSVEESAHSEVHGRVISKARNIMELREKSKFYKTSKIIYQNDLCVPQKSSFLTLFLKFLAKVIQTESFLF